MANQTIKCGVCDVKKDCCLFYCASCIQKGEFSSRKLGNHRRNKFCEKKKRLHSLESKQRVIDEEFCKILENRKILEDLRQLIVEYTCTIDYFEKAIREGKGAIERRESISRQLMTRETFLKKNRDDSKTGIANTKKRIHELHRKIENARQERKKLMEKIKECTKEKISSLNLYIFPIRSSSNDYIQDSIQYNLDENSQSLALCPLGSWAEVNPYQITYTVVESWLPHDGVQKAYIKYSSEHQDHPNSSATEGVTNTRANDVYRVSAALAYIAQLLSMASYFMDVRFPKRLKFESFYTKNSDCGLEVLLSDEELLHNLAKFNANLFYLCLSQNIKPFLLHPHHVGKNLDLLFNSRYAELGRIGPLCLDSKTYNIVQEALVDDYTLMEDKLFEEVENRESTVLPSLIPSLMPNMIPLQPPASNNFLDNDLLDNEWESVQSTLPFIDQSIQIDQQIGISSGIMSSIAAMTANAASYFIRKK